MKISRSALRRLIIEQVAGESKFSPKGTVGEVEVTVDLSSQQPVTFKAPSGEEYDQSPNFDLKVNFVNGEEIMKLLNNHLSMERLTNTQEGQQLLKDKENPESGRKRVDYISAGNPIRKPISIKSSQNFRIRGGADSSYESFPHAEDESWEKGLREQNLNEDRDVNIPVVFRSSNGHEMHVNFAPQWPTGGEYKPIDGDGRSSDPSKGYREVGLKAAVQGQKFELYFTDEFKSAIEWARNYFANPTSTENLGPDGFPLDESLSRGSLYRRRYRRY